MLVPSPPLLAAAAGIDSQQPQQHDATPEPIYRAAASTTAAAVTASISIGTTPIPIASTAIVPAATATGTVGTGPAVPVANDDE